jgi:hypothetical protein
MAKNWQDLRDRMLAETERIWFEEPDELKELRLGVLKNKAGSYDQYFTTIDFANGMIRDFSMYTMYPILKLALNPNIPLEQMKDIVKAFHPPYTDYLRYSGYITLDAFDREFISLMDTFESKDDFIDCYKAFLRYANKVAAWSYHYFPWEIMALYPQKTAEHVNELARLGGTE